MKRYAPASAWRAWILSTACLLTGLGTAQAANAPAKTSEARFEALARKAFETMWEFHPVEATYAGFHKYDGRLGDYSTGRVAREVKRLKGLLSEVERGDPRSLSLDTQIDRELLISNLKTEIFRIEGLRTWERNPYAYAEECVNGIHFLLLRDFAPLPIRARSVAQRMGDVPRVMSQARKNVQDPPRLYAYAAIDLLQSGEQFLSQSTEDLGGRFPALKPELAEKSAKACAAMKAYREDLTRRLPGFKDRFAMGKEDYDYLLATQNLLRFDSDSLLRLGENTLVRTDSLIKAMEKRREEYRREHAEPPRPFVPAPPGFSTRDVLDYEQAEIDSMRAWVASKGLATVPEYVGSLRIVETPSFLRTILPGIAMEPPAPLDSVQTAYFYVRPLPAVLDSAQRQRYYDFVRERGWRGSVVHEGYPGHHLQLSIANHNASLVRKMQADIPLIEGWALYCEEMTVEEGLYPDDGFLALRWLGGVRFRAARVVLDVMLHTGRMSYEEGWHFLMEKAAADSEFAQGEVRRYCLEPTQPMSYLVGKTQIMALRDEYRRKVRERFSLKDFHDRLLREGSIPVGLIRRKMIGD